MDITLVYLGVGLLLLGGLLFAWRKRTPGSAGALDLAVAVEQFVALAEETLPGKSGAEKLAFVLSEIERLQAGGELGQVDPLLLRAMIEAAVKALKMAQEQDGAVEATPA